MDPIILPRARTVMRRDSRGFSLIELMVVMVLMSVLVGLALTMLGSVKSSSTRKYAAAILYSELTAARERAKARQRTQIVIIQAQLNAVGRYGFYSYED